MKYNYEKILNDIDNKHIRLGQEIEDYKYRLSYIDVDLKNIAENFFFIKEKVKNKKVMAIVKANAYGHGLLYTSLFLQAVGVDFFGTAFLEEAIALRNNGITKPILMLGGFVPSQIENFIEHDIDITASSVDKLDAINEVAGLLGKKARVHLKIDTGMERIGPHYYSAEKLLNKSLETKNCEVVGIFSHFAKSETDSELTKLQLERFLEVLTFYDKHSLPYPIRHIANSGAILNFEDSYLDMVRPGAILYGINPDENVFKNLNIKVALSLKSKIVYFKVVRANTGISYGHTYITPEQTRVVTIPIGYGDGFSRLLSNKASVIIRGKKCPIVGNICMDQCMVNIGPNGEGYNDDEVILIGKQGNNEITVNEIANLIGTDPRDILVSLNSRIPRRYNVT
ncbi:MAG: alanine racemase [Bdellovibrionota bacterium]|nr:alanine racemase [Pseudomonadota bacterium]MDY6091249.1 alanine racemase [Bdellovibrionota bacterium]